MCIGNVPVRIMRIKTELPLPSFHDAVLRLSLDHPYNRLCGQPLSFQGSIPAGEIAVGFVQQIAVPVVYP